MTKHINQNPNGIICIICITETWLSANIPDSNVSIPGYNFFRQDSARTTGGGGVCVYSVDEKDTMQIIKFLR
jgi:hypothetical protein